MGTAVGTFVGTPVGNCDEVGVGKADCVGACVGDAVGTFATRTHMFASQAEGWPLNLIKQSSSVQQSNFFTSGTPISSFISWVNRVVMILLSGTATLV